MLSCILGKKMRILIAVLWGTLLAAQTVPEVAGKFTIDGDVPTPLTLTVADLAKMPRETAALAEMNGTKVSYEGVPLLEILKKAGLPFGKEMRGKALAGYLLVAAHDGYEVVFSMGELDPGTGTTRVTVADRRDGQPLSDQQGPIRLVVTTDQRPARSVRMVEALHVVQLRK
jgi:DMSO/TMAO reductase YedYZ molybdopterin-dependent catalytic subunit